MIGMSDFIRATKMYFKHISEPNAVAGHNVIYGSSDGLLRVKTPAGKVTAYPEDHPLWFFNGMTGIVASIFIVAGELRRQITTGETGDYTTDFSLSGQHLSLLVNTIDTGGDIVVTGTKVNENTGLNSVGATETITVDTTAGQLYQTDAKWEEITNIDISAGSIVNINYNLESLGYQDLNNSNFVIEGYEASALASGVNPDLGLEIYKIQDDGSKKYSVVTMESIGFDANNGTNRKVDGLRTGGDNRTLAPSVNPLWGSGHVRSWKQGDFSDYFSNDENVIEGADKNEGIILQWRGEDGSGGGGISNVDHGFLSLKVRFF